MTKNKMRVAVAGVKPNRVHIPLKRMLALRVGAGEPVTLLNTVLLACPASDGDDGTLDTKIDDFRGSDAFFNTRQSRNITRRSSGNW